MGRSLLSAALWAALALVLAGPALAQSPGPTEPCQARLDGSPPHTTCSEDDVCEDVVDGVCEAAEPGGGYFAPIEATASAPAGASALPGTGGPPAVLTATALALISSGVLLARRAARHGRPPRGRKR